MTATTIEQLATFGPERCDTHTAEQARAMCRRLALGHYENFSVLSAVVPTDLRDDFAALYAFCRWADDLGDETGDRERSLDLLAWWRRELHQCFDGRPRHPVFTALRPVIERHRLPQEPFEDLISAFEQDQTINRYATWAQLLAYCRMSANPVGRLVLMLCDEPRDQRLFELSDAACTALQLTNHWQDVKRDALERDRIYIPSELSDARGINVFESRLLASAKQGFGVDRAFLGDFRSVLRACVARTWSLFDQGGELLEHVHNRTRPIVWLLTAGGQHVLRQIDLWNHETVLHRPKLGKPTKAMLIARAWWMAHRGRRGASEARS